MIVQARDGDERLTPSFQKLFFTLHCYLLEGLEAVRNKGGSHDEYAFFPRFHELGDDKVGVGFQPGFASQSGLEGDRVLFRREARSSHESVGSRQGLGFVASSVGRAAS